MTMTCWSTFFDSSAASAAVIGRCSTLLAAGTTGAAPTTPDWARTSVGTDNVAADKAIFTLLGRSLEPPALLIPRMTASHSRQAEALHVEHAPRVPCYESSTADTSRAPSDR